METDMPPKQTKKETTTLKTIQTGPAAMKEPRTQVHLTSGDTEWKSAATSTVSKKEQQELRVRKGRDMRRHEQFELQIPATIGSGSENESEVDLDSLEHTHEDEEVKEEQQEEVGGGRYTGDIKEALAQIMHELKELKTLKIIKEDIKNMKTMFDKMVKKQEKMDKQVKKLEEIMGDTIDRVNKMEDNILAWTSERKRLLEKIDVLERFSRQNNIKIVGLKEGIEGEDPIKFFQKWIPENLEMEEGTQLIEIERVHRASRPKPQPDKNPGLILIKCLRYQVKEKILKAAAQCARKRNEPLMIEGKVVLFHPFEEKEGI
ncbi:uncharacterized protein LOC132393376 [Hypanus sabinus]|uniref:uncharacterized protein LOC132393376 n=1 Tax=Hypanus sabinus TaxID=79690 RepID=UPI0028C394DD|nr:uncharacterized protein LOC132393376 [Hypanus sabinus]